jgi:hypothetical protein
MSTVPSTYIPHHDFASIFNASLKSYKCKTKKDLASYPLLSNSPVLQPVPESGRQADKMGHPNRECIVCVFCHYWPGRWASEYQDILS